MLDGEIQAEIRRRSEAKNGREGSRKPQRKVQGAEPIEEDRTAEREIISYKRILALKIRLEELRQNDNREVIDSLLEREKQCSQRRILCYREKNAWTALFSKWWFRDAHVSL